MASYRALREQHPVAWSEANGGYWIISGYQAVVDASWDDAVFSSARSSDGGEGLTVVIPKTPMHLHIPIELDPPEFRPYRKIINAITAPTAVERMTELIDHYCTWFVDQVIGPSQALARTVTRDVEFHGCSLKRGTGRCSCGRRPTATQPAASRIRISSRSNAGPTGTRPSASASTGAPDPTLGERWPSGC